MSDWSEHLVVAKQHLLKAENALNLKRNAEGYGNLHKVIEELSAIVNNLNPGWPS